MPDPLRGVLFSVGFRPFYLGAAGFALFGIAAWLAVWSGLLQSSPPLLARSWHVHEMLFGFAPAVMVGFLFTAARNWTGLPTASGPLLAALAALWLAGRIAPFVAPTDVAALVDLAFLPCAATCLLRPLLAARNLRNLFTVAVLLVLAAANAVLQAANCGWLAVAAEPLALAVALDTVMLLMVVIAGRIIPAFSANAIPGLSPRRWTSLEMLSIGLIPVIAAADALAPWLGPGQAQAFFWILVAAATLHFVRLIAWQPWKTLGTPLLLILPVSYLWIPLHLLLRAALGAQPGFMPSLAIHALTIGAMTSLMLAMMTRSALGHTGRALRARVPELVCFGAIQGAALLRVVGPLLRPEFHGRWITGAGLLWIVAFVVFLLAYLPILTRPRVDVPAAPGGGKRL